MKYTLKSVRTLAVTLIAIGSLAGGAEGAIIFNFQDQGSDLLVTVSGSLNETGLTIDRGLTPDFEFPLVGDTTYDMVSVGTSAVRRWGYVGTRHTDAFSTLFGKISTTNFGDMVGVWVYDDGTDGNIFIPASYAGEQLSSSSLYSNLNISDIGLTTGTWLTLENDETVEITAIPEPATFAFVGIFGAGMLFIRRYFPSV
jgi:hypothetical protein